MADNNKLVEEQSSLQREICAAKEELQRKYRELDEAKDNEVYRSMGLYLRVAKLQTELQAMEPLKKEASELEAEVEEGNIEDLSAQLQKMKDEHQKLVAENQQIPKLMEDINELQQELYWTRNTIANKRMENSNLVKERYDLENSLAQMAREQRELHNQRASLDRRASFAPSSGGPSGIRPNGHAGSFPATVHQGNSYGSSSTSGGGVQKQGEFDKH